MANGYIKKLDVWRKYLKAHIKKDDVWRNARKIYKMIDGVWVLAFNGFLPPIATDVFISSTTPNSSSTFNINLNNYIDTEAPVLGWSFTEPVINGGEYSNYNADEVTGEYRATLFSRVPQAGQVIELTATYTVFTEAGEDTADIKFSHRII